MIIWSRLLRSSVVAIALACLLSGCGSINEKVSAGVADTMPQWAGGLPADAPPRPGTAEYDRFMKEREKRRQQPAAERAPEDKPPATSR